MLAAGVNLVTALQALTVQPECPGLGEAVSEVSEMVNSGIRLSVAFGEHSSIFPRIYRHMVEIGEQTGQLEDMLSRLADWLERDERLRRRVLKALTYPAFVCVLTIVLTLGLFYTVVPGFLSIFTEMGVPLPWPTRIVKFVADVLGSPSGWLACLAVGLGGYYFLQVRLAKPGGLVGPYRLCLKIPGLGSLLTHGALARFCSSLGVLLASGMELPRAVRLAVLTSGQPLWQADLEDLLTSIREGGPLSQHLRARPDLYPEALAQMLLAGEESAQLSELCARAGAYYEVELGFHIDALSAVTEPLLMAGVSLLVGCVVVSLFLPLYGFLANLGMN